MGPAHTPPRPHFPAPPPVPPPGPALTQAPPCPLALPYWPRLRRRPPGPEGSPLPEVLAAVTFSKLYSPARTPCRTWR